MNIIITGKPASGKSTVQYLLREYLTSLGFEVELVPDDDYSTPLHYETVIEQGLDNGALETIKKKTPKITISTTSTVLPIRNNEAVKN